MEFKNTIVLEIQKEERVYRMEMPAGAPLGEAYQCAGMMLDRLVELINEHSQKRKEEENAKKNESPEEESKESDGGV